MAPLEHISPKLDNTATESWVIRGSVSSATAVGPLLRETVWICRQKQTHALVARIVVVGNLKADAVTILTHLTVAEFNCQFNNKYPQKEPWRLRLLLCAEKHRILTNMHTKQLPLDCLIPPCGKIPPPIFNGRHSAYGCAFQKILQKLRNQYPSSIFLWNRYVQEYFQPKETPFRIETWSNTSAPWDISLRKRGPQTPGSTLWDVSTLGWGNNVSTMRGKSHPPLESAQSP